MAAVSEEAKARQREKNRAYMAARRAADPEAARQKCREQYARDPERHIQRVRAYRASLDPGEARARARNILLRGKYGIGLEDFDALRAAQDFRCAVCHRHEEEIPKPRPGDHSSLVPDHCHEDGQVRGLLCNPCNLFIGHAREDERILGSAIEYLRRARMGGAVQS